MPLFGGNVKEEGMLRKINQFKGITSPYMAKEKVRALKSASELEELEKSAYMVTTNLFHTIISIVCAIGLALLPYMDNGIWESVLTIVWIACLIILIVDLFLIYRNIKGANYVLNAIYEYKSEMEEKENTKNE